MTSDTCANCGGGKGLHHYRTDQCPVGGVEAPDGKLQEWKDSTFRAIPLNKTNGNDEMFGRYINAGEFEPGLTKREYFAAMALQGFTSKLYPDGASFTEYAEFAVEAADALIDALNQEAK
jgi:hypothetical protein